MSELPVILVAEDDQSLQVFLRETLIDSGFEATVVPSGEEAILTLLDSRKGKYRALITDINLSDEMDGWELARRAREIDHAFPVIYMSGSHADEWGVNGVPNSVMLAKPFAPAQLVTALAQLLNAAPPAAPET